MPIGTDAFVQSFVAKTCRSIIDDVEKLDSIQDGFIHYQLLRFCQATRLQYTNSHILLRNRYVLQINERFASVMGECVIWTSQVCHRYSK